MRLIGDGVDAVLVAGGADAPHLEAAATAVRALVTCLYLYGGGMERSARGCVWEALQALAPDVAERIADRGPGPVHQELYGDCDAR